MVFKENDEKLSYSYGIAKNFSEDSGLKVENIATNRGHF